MISRFVIYPYKVTSESAHRLKDALKEAGKTAIIVYPDRNYQCKEGDLIIGWGASKEPKWKSSLGKAGEALNLWDKVENSIDKKKAFSWFSNMHVSIPKYTDQEQEAYSWLCNGEIVVGRKQLRGMKGNGIIIMKNKSAFVSCKLYTKFIPNTVEYRVYVFGDEVIDVIQKRRQQGTNDPGFVRSEENGWVFCRNNVHMPLLCKNHAIKAVKALGLYFAGVDILWSTTEFKPYVLETNTCPDIFGTGLKIFRDAFIGLAEEL